MTATVERALECVSLAVNTTSCAELDLMILASLLGFLYSPLVCHLYPIS